MKPEVLERRLRDFPLTNKERQERAHALFSELGCPQVLDAPVGKKPVPANVLCVFPGTMEKAIVAGAHFDKVPKGEGKIDNASGVVLLSGLIQAMQAEPRRHTLIFIAFAQEEEGLLGSQALVKKGIEGREGKLFVRSLSAMVNIDSVGAGVTAIALTQSDKELSGMALNLAQNLKLDCRIVNVDQAGDSDGSSFRKKDVKTVQFHSLDNDNWKILHSERDSMAALQIDEYFKTYQLIAFYLAQLDVFLDP